MWRFYISGSLEDATIEGVAHVDVPAGSPMPTSALSADYLLVAYIGEEVHEVRPVSLPRLLIAEGRDEAGAMRRRRKLSQRVNDLMEVGMGERKNPSLGKRRRKVNWPRWIMLTFESSAILWPFAKP